MKPQAAEISFEESMKAVSDLELVRILNTERENYLPAAINAAEIELARRGLASEEIETAKALTSWQKKAQTALAEAPLEPHLKAAAFLLTGLFMLIVSSSFASHGFKRKSAEMARWGFYGFLFYIALFIFLSKTF